MFDSIDPDAEICRPDSSDRCSNSDDGQVNANVGGDDSAITDDGCGGVCSGGYKDENNDNEDSALWDESDHELYSIPFCASFVYKPPRNDKCLLRHTNILLFLEQLCLRK
jgi:hypothetical protein